MTSFLPREKLLTTSLPVENLPKRTSFASRYTGMKSPCTFTACLYPLPKMAGFRPKTM